MERAGEFGGILFLTLVALWLFWKIIIAASKGDEP